MNMKRASVLILLPLIALLGMGLHASPSGTYTWATLRVPTYTETYKSSSTPVLQLGHAKEYEEQAFRVCAWAIGDGELLISYGDGGDGVEFHHPDQYSPVCATDVVGYGGHGVLAINLDIYLFQRGDYAPVMMRPEIKAGTQP